MTSDEVACEMMAMSYQGLEQGDRGEALRPGPTDIRGAVRTPLLPLHRGPDLPHRPLPWQGDGAEPDGAEVGYYPWSYHPVASVCPVSKAALRYGT